MGLFITAFIFGAIVGGIVTYSVIRRKHNNDTISAMIDREMAKGIPGIHCNGKKIM